MTNSQPAVGSDILSYCSKCKLELSHIIVAMKTVQVPAKVQCNTCKSTHGYRSRPVKKSSSSTRSSSRSSTQGKSVSELIQEAKKKTDPLKYSPKEIFKKDDLIAHSKFGEGIVSSQIGDDKITVLFLDAERILIHNR